MNKEKIIAFRNATSKPRGSWSLKLVRNLPRKDEDERVNTVIPQVTLPPTPFWGTKVIKGPLPSPPLIVLY